ncbi:MAG: anaerobic sulfatase maturase [Candidatus Latescibacteria bacterium]|nr:anaerobic sulfatase maturase [Candidatus Latescibacterota bacterium]
MRKNLSFLIKPASGDCNLFCDYCFYRKAVEAYPETNIHRMTEETCRELFGKAQIPGRQNIAYMWQGGEPMMMGIDFYRRALEIQEELRLPDQTVSNTIQTNAVLINDEWAELFARHRFLVGVSLDGPKELYDIHRFTRTRASVFDKVIQACKTLERHHVEFNILAVVNNDTVKYPLDIYHFLVDNGFYYLQFIPCIEVIDNEKAPFSVPADEYGDFLCALFDEWFKNGYPYVSIRLFDNLLQYYAGIQPECCMYKDSCGEYLVVEHNGDVYTCDFFVTKEWHIGNIHENTPEEIMEGQKYLEFSKLRRTDCTDCDDCEWLGFCQKGCIKLRYLPELDYTAKNYLCDAYRQFFEHTKDRYRFLAWDIMRRHQGLPVPENIGRNDPCVCGSGKKYKKCCEPYGFILKK